MTRYRFPPLHHRPGRPAGEELAVDHPDWAAAPLLRQCCEALLASFKIWRSATVGGNVALSFPAGAMISLLSALADR